VSARGKLGALGEDAAAALLASKGFHIVARNHRTRLGEVDLIADDGVVLAFVEVRTRRNDAFGGPAETVSARKQERVILAAQDFLARWTGPERAVRFDVVAVTDAPGAPRVEHFENAFVPEA
jgi:putative endonuclease